MFSASSAVRPNILKLTPYRCARDDYSSGILLDANENPHGPALTPELLGNDLGRLNLNRYPDPHQTALKKQLAQLRNVPSVDWIFTGAGSDEAIDLLIRCFCEPGVEAVLTCPPTYGMYKVSAAVNNVAVVQVPLRTGFQLDVDKIFEAIKIGAPPVKILFLCSPGNPTGTVLKKADIVKILEGYHGGIVVVDEAYIDFCPPGSSCVDLLSQFKNLVVLQTFSKSFGLAGIRLGMAYGNPEIIAFLNNVKPPYNISAMTSKIALDAVSPTSMTRFQEMLKISKRDKWDLMDRLSQKIGFSQIRGGLDANFILVKLESPTPTLTNNEFALAVYKNLAELEVDNVVTRFRGNELHCDGCLRITVGTLAENEILLKQWDLVAEIIAVGKKSN